MATAADNTACGCGGPATDLHESDSDEEEEEGVLTGPHMPKGPRSKQDSRLPQLRDRAQQQMKALYKKWVTAREELDRDPLGPVSPLPEVQRATRHLVEMELKTRKLLLQYAREQLAHKPLRELFPKLAEWSQHMSEQEREPERDKEDALPTQPLPSGFHFAAAAAATDGDDSDGDNGKYEYAADGDDDGNDGDDDLPRLVYADGVQPQRATEDLFDAEKASTPDLQEIVDEYQHRQPRDQAAWLQYTSAVDELIKRKHVD